jgi:hypothetical protein
LKKIILILSAVLLASCKSGESARTPNEPSAFYHLPEANPTDLDLSEKPRLYVYSDKGKTGLLDANGNIKVEARFDSIINANRFDVYDGTPFYVGINREIIPKEKDAPQVFFINAETKYESFFIGADGEIIKLGDFNAHIVRRESTDNLLIYSRANELNSASRVFAYVPKSTGKLHILEIPNAIDMTDDRVVVSDVVSDGFAAAFIYDFNGAKIFSLNSNNFFCSDDGFFFYGDADSKTGESGMRVYDKNGELLLRGAHNPLFLGKTVVYQERISNGVPETYSLKFFDAETKTEIASYKPQYDEKNPYGDFFCSFLNEDAVALRIYYSSGVADPNDKLNSFKFVIFDKNGNKLAETIANSVDSIKDGDARRYLASYDETASVYDENFAFMYSFTFPPDTNYYFSGDVLIYTDDKTFSSGIADWVNSRGDNVSYLFKPETETLIASYETGFPEIWVKQKNDKYTMGILDNKTGEFILDAKYRAATYYDDEMIWIETAYYGAYINRAGRVKFAAPLFGFDGE